MSGRFAGCMLAVAAMAMPVDSAECMRVVTLGDSHSAVEAGFSQALAGEMYRCVEHVPVGVAGASIWDLLHDMRSQRRFNLKALAAWHPELILVAFGTNEAKSWTRGNADSYAAAWSLVLRNLKDLFPGARIIVLGPPDTNFPGLGPVRAIEKSAAATGGVGWVDRVEVMGGEGAMSIWRTARGGRYATRDGVHLTADGYSELAKRVATVVAREIR